MWDPVAKEHLEKLKMQAADAKKQMEDNYKQIQSEIKEKQTKTQQQTQKAMESLQKCTEDLLVEEENVKKLENLIQGKHNQFLHGGEIIKTQEEIAERDKQNAALLTKMEMIKDESLCIDKRFNNATDEINDKTKKLKLLFKKYQTKKDELSECEEEYLTEEQELTDMLAIKNLERTLWLEFIEKYSQWNPVIDEWQIPAQEYAENNTSQVMYSKSNSIIEDSEPKAKVQLTVDKGLETQIIQSYRNITPEKLNDIMAKINQWKGLSFMCCYFQIKSKLSLKKPETELERLETTEYEMSFDMGDEVQLLEGFADSKMASTSLQWIPTDEVELRHVVHLALETNFDPHTETQQVYMSYGVDVSPLLQKKKKIENKLK
ncbi:hypothetical protein RFI_02913 [Reticulomyxa filosa]|uniref:Uncharacterized protein n=1 Tax=Reticulomyxa filosa TaxID=46433 RepID=X6P7T5_RETFI|nr:hypothetical protein RFI_02913 [Reticulomyxa filosa]|eukprot:ETO34178.1 hypothetical protein RFI_02913 [Reticulomyxa filosa]